MVRAVAADFDAQCRDLAKPREVGGLVAVFLWALWQRGVAVWGVEANINAWCPRNAMPCHAKVQQRANEGFFHTVYVLFHVIASALQVHQRISHHLAWAVVGHLPAAVGGYHGNVARGQQVVGLPCQALREGGWVFADPERVRRVGLSRSRPCLHRVIRGLVVHQAQMVYLHDRLENDFDHRVRGQCAVQTVELLTAGRCHRDGDAQIFAA